MAGLIRRFGTLNQCSNWKSNSQFLNIYIQQMYEDT